MLPEPMAGWLKEMEVYGVVISFIPVDSWLETRGWTLHGNIGGVLLSGSATFWGVQKACYMKVRLSDRVTTTLFVGRHHMGQLPDVVEHRWLDVAEGGING